MIMKVSEQIAIMKAYADGKTIEKKGQDDTEWKSIEYIEDYPFDFFCEQYRVKQECKYRPFVSVDEAFNEAKKHGFWVKEKNIKYLRAVNSFDNCGSGELKYIDGQYPSYYLKYFVWADDGSPCGVKIE
mgnify:CR=1 FL=1